MAMKNGQSIFAGYCFHRHFFHAGQVEQSSKNSTFCLWAFQITSPLFPHYFKTYQHVYYMHSLTCFAIRRSAMVTTQRAMKVTKAVAVVCLIILFSRDFASNLRPEKEVFDNQNRFERTEFRRFWFISIRECGPHWNLEPLWTKKIWRGMIEWWRGGEFGRWHLHFLIILTLLIRNNS